MYQLVFRFDQFLDFKLTYLLNYYQFCDFDPPWAYFPPYGAFFHTLRLNKGNLTTIECFKCIIKYLYQLVFEFRQFLDFKLPYLLNYGRFCDFDPFVGLFSTFCRLFHTLRLNKGILTTIECLKCIIKCLYQVVIRFDQFLDFRLTYYIC